MMENNFYGFLALVCWPLSFLDLNIAQNMCTVSPGPVPTPTFLGVDSKVFSVERVDAKASLESNLCSL